MLDDVTIRQLAAELHEAERTRVQISQLSLRYPEIQFEDSYRIQREWMRIKLAEGARPIGRKIGMTSRAMQQVANMTEPDYGLLLDHMLIPEGSAIAADRFIQPWVEVELAFILKRELRGPNVTIFDVLDATDWVVPALEIIDARIQRIDPGTGAQRRILDTIADNAANGGIVMGARPIRPDAMDLRWIGGLLYKNGVIEETGLAAGVLNHPANGIAWLARQLSKWDESLAAGDIVLAGSFTRIVPASHGDQFAADYGPLGSINIRFE
ncbi:2-oxo-hept-4-ene-1,7-dioate hydratase [Ferribacterium limneticum]|uniref:2-oxo-hept-4-ene-1,7-dioate hydratase n=1 Tax=Ferribacterium limneticum TaxID=76259 RepID=UPI001CFB7BD4|nr:2-oxo-hepta-3-ene-1,7-dioic acid hydratase [Ferribacterium limneticum]UCV17766.1 2-oxo-hepta-3-ene-1,7-dioic acid hydratase [Ferribacterium limneticum]